VFFTPTLNATGSYKLTMKKAQILLTNDDGIQSPGLWAAAGALSELGFVHVVAPRDQYSGAGRSLPFTSDGIIERCKIQVNGQEWGAYAVGGTPAQAVLHAVLEVLPEKPDLLVSGINFGENVGSGITVSGTVGAALEGASFGIPSMAISLETEHKYHYSHSGEVDFSNAAHFCTLFSRMILANHFPDDVKVLKIDIPSSATPDTPWAITRVSPQRYFVPTRPARAEWNKPAKVGYRSKYNLNEDLPDSDAYALQVRRIVSVSPLSLDLTARIDLGEFERKLRKE
jgi:5'-nucleotidase